MPNIWTHILFCQDVIREIPDANTFEEELNYLNLGAQGPDPFFYHNFLPWQKNTFVNNIGNALHQEYCGPFLLDMITEVTNLSRETKAFVLGFVTHHILDRNTHPYIHYHAGYEGSKHQELEVLIDTVMMKRFRNMDTWKSPVHIEINVGTKLHNEIQSLLRNLIKSYYPKLYEELPHNVIQSSYRDMKRALRVLYDPFSWKNTILKSLISPFSHQPITKAIDYLNEQEETWYHPATEEPSSKGFIDLYEHAHSEAIEVVTEVINFWDDQSKKTEQRLVTLIDNISYDTGLPLRLQLKNKHCKPIV